jgi:signal transduction histidine kinase
MLDSKHRIPGFSLKWRLTLLLALVTGIALGSTAWIVDWRADSEMQQRFDSALLARAQALAGVVQVGKGGVGLSEHGDPTAEFPGNANSSWYEVQCGDTVAARTRQAPPPMTALIQPRFADARLPDGRLLRMVAMRFTPAIGDDAGPNAFSVSCDLSYALDRGSLDSILDSLDLLLLGSLFGVLALVLLLTPWLVRRGLRPLSALERAMAVIGPDAPGLRLPVAETRELTPLVVRFNEVLARMDAGLSRERDFAAGLAHELRTRLAELRALVEIETRYPSGRDSRTMLQEVSAIGTELEATVTALLQLRRIDSGLEQVHYEWVPLLPLLARAQARHSSAAASRGLRFDFVPSIAPDTTIRADAALTDITLDNLIGNAISYAPLSSAITLRANPRSLEVINPAPALEPQHLANFGQRFWRKSEGDRHDASAHTGLGLSLAAAAAHAQRMTLKFRLDDAHLLHATLAWQLDE